MQQVSDLEHQIILDLSAQTIRQLGDWVEFGCYRGDTSILLARQLADFQKQSGLPAPQLYLYDSFAGLPAKAPADQSSIGSNFTAGSLQTSKAALITRFKKANLPLPHIKKAWFSDLDPAHDLPPKISFAFLDGDYYDSIKTSLHLVYPLLAPYAIILIHDYHNEALPGVARATDEFLTLHPQFKLQIQASLAILRFSR